MTKMSTITTTSYSDWCKTNIGIFTQLQNAKPLPFVTADKPVLSLDTQFLAENANKQMVFTDVDVLVTSIIAKYYDTWVDLTNFYKQIPVGVIAETTTTSNDTTTGKDQVALNNDSSLYDISGNSTDSTNNTSTQTKDFLAYKNFMLSANFYDIINSNIRNYIFINVY